MSSILSRSKGRFKGGVDVVDQMKEEHSGGRFIRKRPMRLFFFSMMNIVDVNSQVI